MGDFQQQQEDKQDDLQNQSQAPVQVEDPATAQVRSMLSSNDPQTVKDIGEIIRNNPQSRDAIFRLLHDVRGNRYVTQVQQFASAGGPVGRGGSMSQKELRELTDDSAPTEAGRSEAMQGFREMNGVGGRGIMPAAKQDEIRADANDNAPLNQPTSGEGIKTDPEKAKAAAQEADAVDAEAKPVAQGHRKFNEAELRNIADGDGSALDNPLTAQQSGVKDEAPKENKDKVAEAPVEASKVLKDETVIGASKEEKQPEIVRASEVLKDPEQKPDEPQKASDVVKDDDAENEGGGSAQKPDAGPVKITASVLRVRSSPKISKGNIVGRLTKGTVVQAVGHSGEWVEIQYQGQTAFIHSSFVVGAEETKQPTAQEQIPAAAPPS